MNMSLSDGGKLGIREVSSAVTSLGRSQVTRLAQQVPLPAEPFHSPTAALLHFQGVDKVMK